MSSLRIFATASLGLTLMACGPGRLPVQAPATAPNPNVPAEVAAGSSLVRPGSALLTYMGRFDLSRPPAARMAWPGSAVGARFEGTQISVQVTPEGPSLYDGKPVNTIYEVQVDDATPVVIESTAETTSFAVATGLPKRAHTVWLRKRTESSVGTGHFLEFDTDGRFIEPPSRPSRRLELVGDSALTGYGVAQTITPTDACSFSPRTQDAQKSYGKLAADLLGAEAVNVSYSGKGITRNIVAADNVKTLPYIYGRIIPDDESAPPWDFSEYRADAVVVDAGGNDFATDSNGTKTPPDEGAFVGAYSDLLRNVRGKYPQSLVVAVVGANIATPTRDTLAGYLKQAVNAVGDEHMAVLDLGLYDGADGYGCDYHFNEAAARRYGQQLAEFLRSRLGW